MESYGLIDLGPFVYLIVHYLMWAEFFVFLKLLGIIQQYNISSLKLNGGKTIEGSPNFQTTGRGFGGAPSTKIQFAPQILIFKLICTLNFI